MGRGLKEWWMCFICLYIMVMPLMLKEESSNKPMRWPMSICCPLQASFMSSMYFWGPSFD